MCEYCEEGRNLLAGAEDAGCIVNEIAIEGVCYVPRDKSKPVEEQHRIFVGMDGGEARTAPIRFCPMCGMKLAKAVGE